VFAKHVDHNVKIEDLMHKNADVPGDAEVEAEFEIFQAGDANQKKQANLALNQGDEALVVRYEFYKYLGAVSAEGEALCGGKGVAEAPVNCGGLGDYVGAQIAGFNAVQPPVPEPKTTAMLLAGLGAMGLLAKRRRIR
jgi:PEP-CTERM motif